MDIHGVRVLLAQSCPTHCNPMDCSQPGSPVHRIFPGKNIGMGCHFLLQGIFPTQVFNPGLLHFKQILYLLSYQRSPTYMVECFKSNAFSCFFPSQQCSWDISILLTHMYLSALHSYLFHLYAPTTFDLMPL